MTKRRSVWLALIVLIVGSLACATPLGGRTIKGSGNVVTEERDVSGFDGVALSGFGRVKQGVGLLPGSDFTQTWHVYYELPPSGIVK